MKNELGISEENRKAVINLLNGLLADETILYQKTRNYHWNVRGPQFHDLHLFFETQYEELSTHVDDVAERARTLGGRALGTLAEMLETARLKEQPGAVPAAPEMLSSLLQDHESIINRLRADLESCAQRYSDEGTSNFLTDLMEQHEKMAWMLRSYGVG